MRVRAVEDPTAIITNQLFQESLLAEKAKLTNGYPGEPRGVGQDMRVPSSQHFFVAEGLDTTEEC